MSDIFAKEKRSEIMSKISGKETKPEVIVRKFLFKNGFRYRKNVPSLPGKPDIALSKYKTVVFVNGCFWHGHKRCKLSKLPVTRHEFWRNKIALNIKRDKKNTTKLKRAGWKVLIIWQCEMSSKTKLSERLGKLLIQLQT